MGAVINLYVRRFRWLGSRGSARGVSRRHPRSIGMPLPMLSRALRNASVSTFRSAVLCLMQTPVSLWTPCNTSFINLLWSTSPHGARLRPSNPVRTSSCRAYAARMWSHFHAYRKLRSLGSGAPLSALFRAWQHRALYNGMRAAAKKRSAELRKLRRDRLFATARNAATSGNLREFYKVVRLLAPQGSKRRFQLCQGGVPLPPERELNIMRKHFEQQFASHNERLAAPEPWECDDPVLVHLDKLPARKAGAPSTSPGAVWRLCSDLVSPFIAQQLSDCWGQGRKCVPHLVDHGDSSPAFKSWEEWLRTQTLSPHRPPRCPWQILHLHGSPQDQVGS